VSFILDALKKLEREKDTREPGVVMVGPVPWGGRDRRRRAPGLAAAGVVMLLALGAAFLWLRSGRVSPSDGGADAQTAAPATETATAAPDAAPAREAGAIPPLSPDGEGARSVEAELETPPPRKTLSPSTRDTPLVVPDEGEGIPPENAAAEPAPLPSAEPEYRLTAISSRDGHPIALLNDRLVREGDSFDGVTVVEIGETSVEIEVDGQRQTIGF
jgi:hypothetical protein